MRYIPTIRSGRASAGHKVLARFDKFFNKFEKSYFENQQALAERENDFLRAFIPDIDIEESETMFLIMADIPGLRSDEIRVELNHHNLRIAGERRRTTHHGSVSYYERAHGKFLRSFTIPDNIDVNRIEAHFDDGVLRVILPKVRVADSQEIKIN
jgi:HSP20 family protein